jgi:hypothetical protein
LLFCRRRYVYIDLLRPATAKQSVSKNERSRQNDDHKDHQHCHHARAAATISIVSHDEIPPDLYWGMVKLPAGVEQSLAQGAINVNEGKSEPPA